MPDPQSVLNGSLTEIVNFVVAAGALGTAAMGLVDATKAFWGGPSNFGFGYVKEALEPFLASLDGSSPAFGKVQIIRTLKANWINGVAKADQKATAKSIIHLGLTADTARALAKAAGVEPAKLESLAQKTANGENVTQDEINVLGQFDTVLSAALDAAYERGDQKYRNSAKLLAMIVSTMLGGVGGWLVFASSNNLTISTMGMSLLIGAIATPLAPVAKDLATSLQTAASAVGMAKR